MYIDIQCYATNVHTYVANQIAQRPQVSRCVRTNISTHVCIYVCMYSHMYIEANTYGGITWLIYKL